MGAWIETFLYAGDGADGEVAPYVGAWIETCCLRLTVMHVGRRTLRGCVD